MARQLRGPAWRLPAPVLTLHDRPVDLFRPLPDFYGGRAREGVLARLLPAILDGDGVAAGRGDGDGGGDDDADERSLFSPAAVVSGRARLLVSSTSWTPDEDFSLLLEALEAYGEGAAPVPLLAVVTGRGPQRAQYEARVRTLRAAARLRRGVVRVVTAWLTLSD